MNMLASNMNNNIPIFIHHEIGQKKQAGRDNIQSYLKCCISQAEKFGNYVFLFGDCSSKAWAKNFINAHDIDSKKWIEFIQYFENYSTYPLEWAEGIFKRFFLFREFAITNGLSHFFVLDSDVLLYANLSQFEFWNTIDFAGELPLRQSFHKNDELRWTLCAGISYWTKESICSFTDFCINIYKKNKPLLLKKWKFHQKNNLPGGICEMTLLYLWVKMNPQIHFMNLLNTGINNVKFNTNFMFAEDYVDNEYQLFPFLGIKKVKFKEGLPYLIKQDKSKTRVLNLHFGGDSKLLINDIYKFQRILPTTYLYYLFWNLKRELGLFARKIGIKN